MGFDKNKIRIRQVITANIGIYVVVNVISPNAIMHDEKVIWRYSCVEANKIVLFLLSLSARDTC